MAETYSGGASVSVFSQGVFNNCLFSLNEASLGEGDYSGGGASIWSEAKVDFINCTFAENTAAYGGALTVGAGGIVNSINCIYWENSVGQIALDTYNDLGGILTMKYNDVQGGIDLIDISSESTLNWLEGNIDQNPNFVGSGNYPYQISDYSPCIDAGTPDTTGLNLPEYDLAGEFRIFNERIDIGVCEWNTFVGIEDYFMPKTSHLQVHSYPNPFSTSATIEYELNHPETVRITFYNQFGKQVDLIEERQQQGLNKVVWTPENLAGGIYYLRLEAGEQVASGKVVLVKL